MAYNTKPIVTDKDGNPISQYYNPDTDQYEPVEGQAGANKVLVVNNDLSLIPILEKLSQLTGSVIDEETRKQNEITRQNNEQERIQLYNNLLAELERIEQIDKQVPESVIDSINTLKDKLGELQDLDTTEKSNLVLALNEIYNDLTSHKVEKATQDKLGHVIVDGATITIDENGVISAEAGGNVDSVNGKTGEVVIDVGDIAGLVGSELALGRGASAGIYAIALGRDASAGTFAVTLGDSASAGAYAVALGRGASANNNNEGILGGTGTFSASKWIVPGSFTVNGTKNFEIPHPKPEKKATHVIRHGAVESPTPGDTLYRWKIQATKENDLVTIDLPDYFVWLNKDVQIFVTPQGHFGAGYGELDIENEQLIIHCQCPGKYNILVIGTRNDDHPSVQEWYIKGVEREIGESWTGETYVFEVDEIMEIEEIKEVNA